jgi:hypothetical protein
VLSSSGERDQRVRLMLKRMMVKRISRMRKRRVWGEVWEEEMGCMGCV